MQGRTYAYIFGLAERFIGAKVLEISREHWLGDQVALEAFGMLLARRGWPTRELGGDTPVQAMLSAVDRTGAQAAVVIALGKGRGCAVCNQTGLKGRIAIYEVMPGWQESTAGARSWAQLPAQAIKYVRRVEELIGCPVAVLSTSPERDDTILMRNPFEG